MTTERLRNGRRARASEDQWSDIDLFFCVAGGEPGEVVRDFSVYRYGDFGAVHHFDLTAGAATYRAFLLDGQLEVDLGEVPIEGLKSHGGVPFRVVFGEPWPRAGRPG